MKFIITAIIFSSSLFISCGNGKKGDGFLLNDTFFLKQVSIGELGEKYSITFTQYEGFSFHSKDSIFGTMFFNIPEQRTIENDLVDSFTINKLKKSKVDKVVLKYTLAPKDNVEDIKRIIKNRFRRLIIKEDLNNNDLLIMDDRKQVVCRVIYSNFALRNYLLEYYPIKQ
jgi:hypothetical protein